jgi:hypothetical protein
VPTLAVFIKYKQVQQRYFLAQNCQNSLINLFANTFTLIRDSENSNPLQQENTSEKNLHL